MILLKIQQRPKQTSFACTGVVVQEDAADGAAAVGVQAAGAAAGGPAPRAPGAPCGRCGAPDQARRRARQTAAVPAPGAVKLCIQPLSGWM